MVGEYRVEWKLGEGGMAQVFAATHPVIGKKAAIKVISPTLCTDADCVERFVAEARAANEIGHPNIIDVFAFGRLPDGRCYFVMEWLQGEPLSHRIDREPLRVGEACAILEQICVALEAAHEKGIVHRDLKPDNVFLVPVKGRGELVKLLDFGIAKLIGRKDGAVRWKTEPDFVMGTPEYLSPEQGRGRGVDHRTDIYALGIIAHEMMTGHVPFVAASAIDVIHMQMHDSPPRMRRSGVPRALERLIRQMLAKKPDDRPTLAQVRWVLREVHSRVTTEAVLPRRAPRTKFLFAAVGFVLVSGVALASVALRQEPARTEARLEPPPVAEPAQIAQIETAPPRPAIKSSQPAAPRAADGHRAARRTRGGDYLLDPFAKRPK
jgi:serine/threonine-protein kinase